MSFTSERPDTGLARRLSEPRVPLRPRPLRVSAETRCTWTPRRGRDRPLRVGRGGLRAHRFGPWHPEGAGRDRRALGGDRVVNLEDIGSGGLNVKGVNTVRSFPVHGTVIWGARTMKGSDRDLSEWKYVPVRRMALYVEQSLFRGLTWAVFEPNDEPLWASIRLNVGAFMYGLFRQGAFEGAATRDAYFVSCDRDTTTQDDVERGIVNVLVGFAPLKPAEFVVLKISPIAGQAGA